jgi:hypothetical protein
VSILPTLTQYSTGIPSQSNRTREKKIRGIQIRREEIKLSIFVDDMILFLKDPQRFHQKLLDLINTFGNIAVYKITIQKSSFSIPTMNE